MASIAKISSTNSTQRLLNDGHRTDMLLDLAGLDKTERTMIQASVGNVGDFDQIA